MSSACFIDTWTGVGLLEAGLHRQGFDLALEQFGVVRWSATLFVSGMEHSKTKDVVTATAPTPWCAVQDAAREMLRRAARVH